MVFAREGGRFGVGVVDASEVFGLTAEHRGGAALHAHIAEHAQARAAAARFIVERERRH
jgi:hypothetical protein